MGGGVGLNTVFFLPSGQSCVDTRIVKASHDYLTSMERCLSNHSERTFLTSKTLLTPFFIDMYISSMGSHEFYLTQLIFEDFMRII